MIKPVVFGFQPRDPRYFKEQESALEWLAEAHVRALRKFGEASDYDRVLKKLHRFGGSPDKISKRGHEHEDFLTNDFSQMKLFHDDAPPEGADGEIRNAFFAERVLEVFREYYPEGLTVPDELLHVTCTGYHAPSAPEVLAGESRGHSRTLVTHLYHMGCYASIPAIRTAIANLGLPRFAKNGGRSGVVDIVHTELCSLHLNPALMSAEQLVVQSLFADGFIKYSVAEGGERKGFEVLGLLERVIPDSLDDMGWTLSRWGMKMVLSRQVPERVSGALEGFLKGLFTQSGFDYDREASRTLFAIHPGGPRIIDEVKKALDLEEWQVSLSRKVLFERGNLSSATLPHVWDEILKQDEVPSESIVASLAFGPGLTVAGALFRKLA